MDIKKIINNGTHFVANRFAELIGLSILILSILLFIALMSYSPEDPNFVFSKDSEIKNILGYRGSYTSDILFQSLGLISIIIPISLFFTGLNVLRKKKNFNNNRKYFFYNFVFNYWMFIFFCISYRNLLVDN